MVRASRRRINAQQLTYDIWKEWAPPPEVKAVDWVPGNVVMPEETETPGAFDISLVPHVQGVLEAADDPLVNTIYLMWASRNAKTTTSLSLMMYWAKNKPRPMMYANADEESANDAMESQLYPLLENCEETKVELLPPHKRNKKFVRLDRCRIRRSYAGSAITMRGFPACYALASEVSAWPNRKSADANALHLFGQRGKLFPFDRKYIYESTPAMVGNCKITELMEKPGVDVRVRIVPCPHCGTYQRLKLGTPDPNKPGIKWKRGTNGHSIPQLTEETAYYQCEKGCKIENQDRPEMMRAGVWWPENDPFPKPRKGKKVLPMPPFRSATVGFSRLSTLYSLLISGWGQLAREWVEAQSSPEARRDFINSTLCETWDPAPKIIEPQELGLRLSSPYPQGLCPDWSVFLTEAIDVQDEAEEFHWQVCAWGALARGAVIDYGVCYSFKELVQHFKQDGLYPHEDGGEALSPRRRGIDSGDGEFTEVIYAHCRKNKQFNLIPLKGDSQSKFPEMAVPSNIDPDKKGRRRRHKYKQTTDVIYRINTLRTNNWIESILKDQIKPDDPDGFTLAQEIANDTEFLEELINERAVWEKDKSGYKVRSWKKTGPNEQRDCLRYNRAFAEVITNHGKHWKNQKRVVRKSSGRKQQAPGSNFGKQTMSILGLSKPPRLTP